VLVLWQSIEQLPSHCTSQLLTLVQVKSHASPQVVVQLSTDWHDARHWSPQSIQQLPPSQ
jgi:hypothetical protein